MDKLRHWEWTSQGPMASEGQSGDLNLRSRAPMVCCNLQWTLCLSLSTVSCCRHSSLTLSWASFSFHVKDSTHLWIPDMNGNSKEKTPDNSQEHLDNPLSFSPWHSLHPCPLPIRTISLEWTFDHCNYSFSSFVPMLLLWTELTWASNLPAVYAEQATSSQA